MIIIEYFQKPKKPKMKLSQPYKVMKFSSHTNLSRIKRFLMKKRWKKTKKCESHNWWKQIASLYEILIVIGGAVRRELIMFLDDKKLTN